MEEALRARLLADTTLAGMVAKVAWNERPQWTGLPAITLQMVWPGREYTHDGWDGLNNSLVQIDVWAKTEVAVLQIARRLQTVIEIPASMSGWNFGPVFLSGWSNMPSEDLGGGNKVHRIQTDWRVFNSPA